MKKADDILVFILFLMVGDHVNTMGSRALQIDRGIDQISAGAFFDLDYHL